MLRDYEKGKNGLIHVKSVIHFGRDALEVFRIIRILKEMGIGLL